jgi:two-component system, OmpR family, phosphate regulon sensor histidine kinase PhoR
VWLALCLGGPPLAILAALALTQSLAVVPFLAGAALLVLFAGIASWLVQADLDRIAAMLDRLGAGIALRPGEPQPFLPFFKPLAAGLAHLARRGAAEAARLAERRGGDEAIVERLPDALLILDAAQSVIRTNAAARAAFGAEIPAVLRHPELRGAIGRALASGEAETADVTIPVPVERTVRASILPLDHTPSNRSGGHVVLVLSDRTREHAIERMRADFVANASHELRTPLASLIGFIDTLRGPAADDPPAQRRFLGIMAGEAARMQRLIDDLLSLSRIELVEHQPPAGAVELANLLPRIAAGFEPRLAERHMQLRLALAPELPPVIADADQLAQVVQNLLDNAVKYGRENGIVQVSAEAQGTGASFAVTDDGPGIPRQHLPRLTERFYRVDKGRSRAIGGTGLGLAIVKHIVNRHRGQLTIESSEGNGSTFRVWLPASGGLRPSEGSPSRNARWESDPSVRT